MGTMDEVIEHLDETEKQAADLIRQLQEAESLHKSLTETRKGLETIVGDVKKLITATLEGVEGLADAVRGLKTATNTIQQSDPGRIAATLKNIETQIEALAREVSAISETKTEVAELKETITRTASVNEERTRAMINDAIDEVSGQSLMERVLGQRRSPKPKQRS
jgi:prefoldin subunit 5